MENTKNIKQFLSTMTDKNYSDANQHLAKMVEAKLTERIKKALETKK